MRLRDILLLTLPVAAALASCGDNRDFDATGIFDATEVTLSAATSGRVLEINADEGDTVKACETLAVIDTMQLYLQRKQLINQMNALLHSSPDVNLQLASMRREMAYYKAEKRRLENLLADGAATTKQLDDINSSIEVLQGRIDGQLSTLTLSSASIADNAGAVENQIEQLDCRLADSHVKSPINATVIARYAEPGEYVAPGRPLLKIADLGNMHLRAYLTSEQLADVKLGQKVTVTADFGADSRFDYPGTVTWIASESEFTPKNIQTADSRANLVYAVKIAVKNDGRLKLGGYGEVKL